MDPITGLSVVCNAAQLVDYMFKIVTNTAKIYKSTTGAYEENQTLEHMAMKLRDLSAELVGGSHLKFTRNTPGILAEIVTTAQLCENTAQSLLKVLEKLKRSEHTLWESFNAALRSVWNKSRVDTLCSTICHLQSTLITQLQYATLNNQSSISDAIREIDDRTARMGISQTKSLIDMRDMILSDLSITNNKITEILGLLSVLKENGNYTQISAQRRDDAVANEELFLSDPELPHQNISVNDINKVVRWVDQIFPQLVQDTRSITQAAWMRREEQKFLSTLYFDTLQAREDDIKAAHFATFRWIFHDTTSDGSEQLHFASWLSDGNGIFWIRGKAGSGKSTLMKFILRHTRTVELLERWAGTNQLITPKHFFWNSGSKLQKSQTGLCRTIVFDLLRHCPEVIPKLRKEMPHIGVDDYQWSMEYLVLVMEFLAKQELSKNFCFFIDGMDEFEGDQYLLIEMLQHLASFRNAKVCCSSRPWTCFIDAFGEDTSHLIKLENLTKTDIRDYVRDNFHKHTQFRKHSMHPQYKDLIENVVERAQGVFLWVFLVVRSLRDGLTYADSLSDLQKRLNSLPPDLESFFQHILDTVPDFYHQKSSELFILTASAPESLPLLILTILERIDEGSANNYLTMKLTPREVGNVDEWKDQMSRRLDARTKGLIEVKSTPPQFGTKEAKSLTHLRAEYLHRTVRDFLCTGDINSTLEGKCRPNFDPAMRLCQAFLVLIRSPTILEQCLEQSSTIRGSYHCIYEIRIIVESFIHFAWRVERERGAPPTSCMNSAEKSLEILLDKGQHYPRTSLLDLALNRGMHIYAIQSLKNDPDLIRRRTNAMRDESLLTLSSSPFSPFHRATVSTELVHLLLDFGVSPNERCGRRRGGGPWHQFLMSLTKFNASQWAEELGMSYVQAKEIAAAMVAKGAELNRTIVLNDTAKDIILERFDKSDAKYIIGLSPMSPLGKIRSVSSAQGQSLNEQNPLSFAGRLTRKLRKGD